MRDIYAKYSFSQVIKLMMTLLALVFCIHAINYAESHEDHAAHSGAHTHGTAILQIAMEGDSLSLEIRSPAMNLVGFEHAAHTTEQVSAVQRAQTQLATADTVFRFTDGKCKPVEMSWDFSAVQADEGVQDSNASENHNKPPGAEDANDEQEETLHGNIIGRYRYQCSSPASLESLAVTLFEAFSGVHAVQVEWIVHGRQGAVTLDRDNNQISFR